MLPPINGGPAWTQGQDRHKLLDERLPIRRGAPEALDFNSAAEPFVTFEPIAKAHQPQATLIELARDPRFRDRSAPASNLGIRAAIGRGFLRIGFLLLRSPQMR